MSDLIRVLHVIGIMNRGGAETVIVNLYCKLNAIIQIDYDAECAYTKKHIKEEYIAAYGNAAEKAVQVIFTKE